MSEHVRGEPFEAPVVVDDDLASFVVRLAPEVDRLAVVADDVTVTRTIRVQRTTVVELEPLPAAGRSGDDLDFLTFEPVSAEHDESSIRVGGKYPTATKKPRKSLVLFRQSGLPHLDIIVAALCFIVKHTFKNV